MDFGVLGKGKSDPYAIITLGAQQFRTDTIDNTVNPKWDFWCEVSLIFFCFTECLLQLHKEMMELLPSSSAT